MWFTETPWPPVLICAVLAVFAFAAYHARRENRYLVAIGVLVLIGACLVLVERQIVTPAEEVEQAIYDLCDAFQRDSKASRDQGALEKLLANRKLETLEHISAHATDLRRMAVLGLRLVTVEEDFHISDVQVKMKADNSRALAHCRVNGAISYGNYGSLGWKPSRWLLTWQQEEGRWKVIKAERLDVITGQALDNPLSPSR